MKRVVSVSLGSRSGDFTADVVTSMGVLRVERRGTDGDAAEALEMIRRLDGRVSAIGLGGINFWYHLGDRRYEVPGSRPFRRLRTRVPLVDGSGVKRYLEPWLIERGNGVDLSGKKVLVVSVLDRYFLARQMVRMGAVVRAGDPLLALGLPLPLDLEGFELVARLTMPLLSKIPLHYLYPVGRSQEVRGSRGRTWADWADVIAGDSHFILRYLLPHLEGKTAIVTTLTPAEETEIRGSGARVLGLSPVWEGRRVGANLFEAVLRGLGAKRPEEDGGRSYREIASVLPGMAERLSD